MSTFAERLQEARVKAGYTQQQVASHFKVTRGAVAQWESGAIYPEASRLAEIAEFLDCSLDHLFRSGPDDSAGHKPNVGKFWMVYGIGQRGPAHRHFSEDAAKTEALRLAGISSDTTFVVLEATSAFRSEKPRIVEFGVRYDADDGIPF